MRGRMPAAIPCVVASAPGYASSGGAGLDGLGLVLGLLLGFGLAALAFLVRYRRRQGALRAEIRRLAAAIDALPSPRSDGNGIEAAADALPEIAMALTRLEQRLQEQHQAQNLRLREAEGEAIAQHSRADAALRAKSRFLASASHDLRQPLHAMGIALQGMHRSDTDSAPALLAQIDDGLEAVSGLLDTMLELSRLEARLVQPEACDVALWEVFSEIEAELFLRAAASGTCLHVRPGAFRVHADPTLLTRLLRELLANAIAAAPGGRVLLLARQRGDRVRVEVRDDGIGISPVHHERVFDDFFQVDNPERDRRKGFGLGLPVAARIAELLGTRLDLRSALQRGSCFALTLEPAREPAPAARTGGRRPRGIVIDRDDACRLELLGHLRQWGLVADGCAAPVPEALDRQQRRPDFIIAELGTGAGSHPDLLNPALETLARRAPGATLVLTCRDDPARAATTAHRLGATAMTHPLPLSKLRALLNRPRLRLGSDSAAAGLG